MLRLTSSRGQYRITTVKSFRRAGSSVEVGTPVVTILSGNADLLHRGEMSTTNFEFLPSQSIRIGKSELDAAIESTSLLIQR